jgi:hypothetical protein
LIIGRWNLQRKRRPREEEFKRKNATDARDYTHGKNNKFIVN